MLLATFKWNRLIYFNGHFCVFCFPPNWFIIPLVCVRSIKEKKMLLMIQNVSNSFKAYSFSDCSYAEVTIWNIFASWDEHLTEACFSADWVQSLRHWDIVLTVWIIIVLLTVILNNSYFVNHRKTICMSLKWRNVFYRSILMLWANQFCPNI